MVGVKFTGKVYATGNSLVITLPEELRNFIEIDVGNEIYLQPEKGKKGKYISIWKKDK